MGGDLNPLVVTVLAEKRRDTYIISKGSDFFGAGCDCDEQLFYTGGGVKVRHAVMSLAIIANSVQPWARETEPGTFRTRVLRIITQPSFSTIIT